MSFLHGGSSSRGRPTSSFSATGRGDQAESAGSIAKCSLLRSRQANVASKSCGGIFMSVFSVSLENSSAKLLER